MTANATTQFSFFDQPLSRAERAASRPKRRAHLPDLVQDVSQLGDEDLIVPSHAALGEARRRGIGPVSAPSSPIPVPVSEPRHPLPARIIVDAAPLPGVAAA